jgi:Lon protease-like protein
MPNDAATGPRTIPLFPLENVVLLPRVQVPLHIFEERYRQMTHAALAGDELIGMVVVKPDQTGAMAGAPAVFEIGCEGRIEQSEELDGGRFNIVLTGTTRFRVLSEEPVTDERLFRQASIDPLAEECLPEDAPLILALRGEVHELMRELIRSVAPARVDTFDQQPFTKLDDERFVNSFAQSIDFSAFEKQGLLESNNLRERYERLAGLMRFRLAELASNGQPGPGQIH